MSNPDEMRRKLEALEAEVTQETPRQAASNPTIPTTNQKRVKTLQRLFEGLPPIVKVAAIAVGILVGLSLLSMVLRLLVSVVVVAVLGIGGYVAYQMFLADDE